MLLESMFSSMFLFKIVRKHAVPRKDAKNSFEEAILNKHV
jgi:hypothetical protein